MSVISRLLALALLLCAPVPLATAEGDAQVIRDRLALTLAGAQLVLAAAQEKAVEMGLEVNIYVVDRGGHPVAFARMDGARPASSYTALTKAATAALKLADTGPIGDDPLLNLAIENAATTSGGKFTSLNGGIVIRIDDQVVGGIGVGGATGEQDAEIARAGLAALRQSLAGE